MHITTTLFTAALLGASCLSPHLHAQAGIGWIDQDANTPGVQNWKLSDYFTSKPGTAPVTTMGDITTPAPIWSATGGTLNQVSTGKTGIAGLQPGEFHMCVTTRYLSSYYGGLSTSQQVLMGKVTWNGGAPVFTPNTMAASMNTTGGNVFGLMIDDKDGLVAAVDWPTGAVVSQRTSNAVPFPTPVLVTGVTGTYVDPAPAYVDGQLVLFWVDAPSTVGAIVYAPLTIQGGTASVGAKVTVISIAGRLSHSPTLVCAANGDTLGMWFASRVGSDSDMYYTSSIRSPVPTPEWDNGTNWINNGAVAGGRILAASNVADGYYGRLLEGQGYHLSANSDITVAPLAVLKLRIGAQSSPTLPLSTSAIAVSLQSIPPVSLPGILGAFALNPAAMLFPVPPGIAIANADDFGEMQLPANSASLKGFSVEFQALSAPLAPAKPAFTNTAKVRFL